MMSLAAERFGSPPHHMGDKQISKGSPRRSAIRRWTGRLTTVALLATLAGAAGGCQQLMNYANLRNSFFDPSQVGRFDKSDPFGTGGKDVRPVRWPILDTLDAINEPANNWATATDPTPADLVPEVKEYVIGPGDSLNVSIFELVVPGQETVQTRQVNELGYVDLQYVGEILCTGLTPTQLQQKIAQRLIDLKILPPPGNGQLGPQVSVTVAQSRSRVFSVIGAVSRPGTYNVMGDEFRLLDALALAGDMQIQPGMDYLYVIRQTPYVPPKPGAATTEKSNGAATQSGSVQMPNAPAAGPTQATPYQALQSLEEQSGSQPAPSEGHAMPKTSPATKSPATGPGASLTPRRTVPSAAERSIITAMVASAKGHAATAPGTSAAGTMPATHLSATTKSTKTLLEEAVSQPPTSQPVRYVFIDGRWVPIQVTPPKPGEELAATQPAGVSGTTAIASGRMPAVHVPTTAEYSVVVPPEKIIQQRVIRIPLKKLRQGVAKYNIIVRPGDVINVPPVTPGEFYVMGNVQRPGVYSLTGRKVTLKMAVAAAGNLGPLAVPRRCELVRRIGDDQEAIVQVNLQAIFDGEQPDIFLKPNDVLNVGTDALAPFLAVFRNAYRLSYGFGFVYDRNYYITPTIVQ